MPKKIICIIAPGSARTEYAPIKRSPYRRVRSAMRRVLDRIVYGLGGWSFSYTTYEYRDSTNRGDSAIRLASRQLLEEAFDDSYEFHEFGWTELTDENQEWIRGNARMFIIAGGGYFFFDKHGRMPPRVVRDLEFLKTLNCPVVTFSAGVNHLIGNGEAAIPHVEPATLAMLRIFLDRLRLCSVRSAMAGRVLSAMVSEKGKVRVLPDPALLMRSQKPNPSLRPAPEGVTTVGINMAFHGPFSSALLQRLLPIVVESLRRFAKVRPCRLVYFVHADGERLVPSLLRQAGLPIEVVDRHPAEMIGAFQAVDIHLCQMLHSSIFAANAGVPTVNIAYDMKNLGFFELLTLGDWCLPHQDLTADRLTAALEALYERRHVIRKVLKERKAELAADMAQFLSELVGVMEPEQGKLPDAKRHVAQEGKILQFKM